MNMRWNDIVVTSLAPTAWGTTYLVTTHFLPADRPLLAGALRALPVGLLLLLAYRRLPQGKWWGRSMILGTLNIGLFFALLFVAAYRLPGGVAAAVGATQPLVAGLLGWLLLAERPSGAALLAALGGVLGVGLIVIGPAARLDPVGILAAAGATAAMATGTVLTRRWGRPVPLPVFTAWQLAAGGVLLAVLTLLIEGPLPSFTARNLAGATYLGLLGTGLAYALWFRGIERLGTTASFLLLLSPVTAVVLGLFVAGEALTPTQMAGVALVLGSTLAGQLKPAVPRHLPRCQGKAA